jgi:hypothetical protein
MYMLVCTTDFVLFPVLWSLVQVVGGGEVRTQWSPITLQGAGLFHMAMGAILGIAAYGRTQEKMAGANNGGISAPAPAPSFSAPAAPAPAFGGTSSGGNTVSTAPAFGSSTAKSPFAAPAQPPHPEI